MSRGSIDIVKNIAGSEAVSMMIIVRNLVSISARTRISRQMRRAWMVKAVISSEGRAISSTINTVSYMWLTPPTLLNGKRNKFRRIGIQAGTLFRIRHLEISLAGELSCDLL